MLLPDRVYVKRSAPDPIEKLLAEGEAYKARRKETKKTTNNAWKNFSTNHDTKIDKLNSRIKALEETVTKLQNSGKSTTSQTKEIRSLCSQLESLTNTRATEKQKHVDTFSQLDADGHNLMDRARNVGVEIPGLADAIRAPSRVVEIAELM